MDENKLTDVIQKTLDDYLNQLDDLNDVDTADLTDNLVFDVLRALKES